MQIRQLWKNTSWVTPVIHTKHFVWNQKVTVHTGGSPMMTFVSGEIPFIHLLYTENKLFYVKKEKNILWSPVPWNNKSNGLTWKEILSCENWYAPFMNLWTKVHCDVYSCCWAWNCSCSGLQIKALLKPTNVQLTAAARAKCPGPASDDTSKRTKSS